jgi:prophage regulatory protein
MKYEIWRLPRVLAVIGHGRSTFYCNLADGLWTKPVKLGPRSVGWPSIEVEQLARAIVAGYSGDAMRSLVRELEVSRRFETEAQ